MKREPKFIEFIDALRMASEMIDGGAFKKAARWSRYLIRQRPADSRPYNLLGMALQRVGGTGKAYQAFRRALVLQPDTAEYWANVANAARHGPSPETAVIQHGRALFIRPDDEEFRFALGISQLHAGDYRRGFQGYEYRGSRSKFDQEMRDLGVATWDGGPIEGKDILVSTEQGAGDAVQFIRFVPMLAALGANVTVSCDAELMALLATAEGVHRTTPNTQPVSCHLAELLMSLPYRFGTTLETIPSPGRYLNPPRHRHRLPDAGRMRVGICWVGNLYHVRNVIRSCPLEHLVPLFDIPDIDFYSLQMRFGRWDPADLPTLVDLAPHSTEFLETAGLIDQLDLVLTVDTSIAHIAGALAKPTWLMLSTMCDWRWMSGREDSPWYPSMRLIRQRTLDDWPELVSRVGADLEAAAADFRRPSASQALHQRR